MATIMVWGKVRVVDTVVVGVTIMFRVMVTILATIRGTVKVTVNAVVETCRVHFVELVAMVWHQIEIQEMW